LKTVIRMYIVIPPTEFNRQLTGEVGCIVPAGNSTDKRGTVQGSGFQAREPHKEGADERRDGVASASAGWKGGAEMFADEVKVTKEGNEKGLRGVVKKKFGGEAADCDIFARGGWRMALRILRVVLEGEPRERET
jgi:hypothetical protein